MTLVCCDRGPRRILLVAMDDMLPILLIPLFLVLTLQCRARVTLMSRTVRDQRRGRGEVEDILGGGFIRTS